MINYEVNKNNEVMAWNDELEQTEPFLYQPHYPDGTPFENKEAAEEWAALWYAHFTDPENNPEYPSGPKTN